MESIHLPIMMRYLIMYPLKDTRNQNIGQNNKYYLDALNLKLVSIEKINI